MPFKSNIKSMTLLALTSVTVAISSLTLATTPATPAPAMTSPTAAAPLIIPPAPDIDAKGYVLMDANSGAIIAQKNMDKKMPPASLTKLMTLYVASQAIDQGQINLDDKVTISEKAWKTGGSRMFVNVGSHVPLKDLIDGVIIASGNDACVAIAQYVAGDEKSFAHIMNQTAARLGMRNSHFTDSTGLPNSAHFSTPHDLAILAQHIVNDFPQDYTWYKQKWIKYNNIRQPNRNRLLWRDADVDGLKTGHTKAAGYCLISSAKRDDMRLISVVMGTPSDSSRTNDSQALINWGFRFYKTYKLFDANQAIQTPRVWLGQNKHIPVGLTKPFYVTIPNGSYNTLKAKVTLNKTLKAPIQKGEQVGQVQVTLGNKDVTQLPLLALQDDPKGGLWSRFFSHIALFFHTLF